MKKLKSLKLMLLAVVALCSMNASAESLVGKTIFKAPFKYTIKTALAAGTGTVKVEKNDADALTTLTIPETFEETVEGDEFAGKMTFTVEEIVASGFASLPNLESVSLPKSIKKIGAEAFAGDYALATLTLADDIVLDEIGNEAFNSWIQPTFDLSKATKLKELPEHLLTTASARAGSGNMFITKVVLPTSITTPRTALAYLPNLATLNIVETATATIPGGFLAKNTKITNLELPATVTLIEANALQTTAVTDLTINAYTTDASQTINAVGVDLNALTVKGVFKGTFKANAGDKIVKSITFDSEFQGAIEAAAFKGVENVTFAKYNPAVPANVAAGCIELKDADNVFPVVTFGELAKAITTGAVKGVDDTDPLKRCVTLKVGKISGDLSAAGNIVTQGVGEAIVTDVVNNKLALDIFGDAKKLTFKGDINNFAVAANAVMANLLAIDFENHELKNTFATGSLENLTNLVSVNWTPADSKARAAFAIDAFAGVAVGAAATITMTTTTNVAYTLYNWDPANNDATLYNVLFVATAPTPEVVTSTIKFEGEVAPDGYYYATVYIPMTQECTIDKVDGLTVYSVYLDGAAIYNNPLRVIDGKYYINGGLSKINAGLIVKSKTNTDVTITNVAGSGLQSIQNALYAATTDPYDGLLYNAGAALSGAKIIMENPAFTLVDNTIKLYSALADPHDAIVRVSDPKTTQYVRYADFDPTTQPTKAIAEKGFFLLAKKVATSAPRQVIWLDDMGNTTAIESVEAATEVNNGNNFMYNVAGQKVSADYKGLVIKNGKKFIQK